jgi:hypothetical protein
MSNELVPMETVVKLDETFTQISNSLKPIEEKLKELKEMSLVWDIQSSKALTEARGVLIKNNTDYTDIANTLVYNKEKLKHLEAIHKTYRDPFNGVLKIILDCFKSCKSNYEKCIEIESGAVTAWNEKIRLENERLQREAEAKAQAEAKKLEEKAAKAKTPEKQAELLQQAQMKQATVVSVNIPIPKISGITQKEVWEVDTIDVKLLPKEWMEPNIKMINDVGAKTEGKITIPGVTWKKVNKTIGARR